VSKLWWMVQKDLVSELRTGLVWPPMCLFGLLVAAVFSFQMELLADQRIQIAGGLLWLATVFAGMLVLDRTFAAEREEGCWHAMKLYPVSATMIYFAKFAVNVITLAIIQLILIALFVFVADIPLFKHPWAMLSVAVLGNLGIASAGTILSALGLGIRGNSGLLSLLILAVVIPVVIAAAEATRLICTDDLGDMWRRWIHLLVVFVLVFISAGAALIDFIVEE